MLFGSRGLRGVTIAAAVSLLAGMTSWAAPAADDFDARLKARSDALPKGAKTHADRTAKFFDAARKTKNKRMQIALLQKAVEYGKKSKPAWALKRAKKALDLLERRAPERIDEWTRTRIELYERGF